MVRDVVDLQWKRDMRQGVVTCLCDVGLECGAFPWIGGAQQEKQMVFDLEGSSSGWLAQKTGAGPTFQWAGKVDAICRSRSNRAKRPRAGCILRGHHQHLLNCKLDSSFRIPAHN